jgi:hypothetical protein
MRFDIASCNFAQTCTSQNFRQRSRFLGLLIFCRGRRVDGGKCRLTKVSAGMPWDRPDLFFLSDALARGMSIKGLAGFLNRSEDEIRQQASSRGHESFSSSDSASESQNRSIFSAASPDSRAKRRTSAARLRHSDLS